MTYPTLNYTVVSGSTGEVYKIAIRRSGSNLTCTCTCPAGQHRRHCKHRVHILKGDVSIVDGGDTDKFDMIPEMVAGTDVEIALNEFWELDRQRAEIDRKLRSVKKALARALDD